MLKRILTVGFLASSLALTACTSTPSSSSTSAQKNSSIMQLQQHTWIATHLGMFEIKNSPTTPNRPSLQFDSNSNRFSGSDGCNRIMGNYKAGRDTLTLTDVTSTRMLCNNGSGVEQKFQDALSKVTHYQVYNKNLKLLDRHGNPVMQLISVIQPR